MVSKLPSLIVLVMAIVSIVTADEHASAVQIAAPALQSSAVEPAGAPDDDTVDKDYASELPRIPATSLEEAKAALQVLPGFTVQLVAAEPLVSDPIAVAFDARGRLFVIEMRDYSEQATERLGRVALLVDRNRDGVYDDRTTFVEGLSWPTAIWPWRDGVLVAEPPRLTWYRDTDDDGRSDVSEDWFVGFARSNVQGLVNSLRWGIDGRIHGATSSSGATIEAIANASSSLDLGRRDFAIDPLNKTLHAEAGGGQHGLGFNRWGEKFVTSNSDHLQQVINIESWLAQQSSRVPMPSTRRSIAEDGPQAEVFRASPVEPWRIVRTRLRVSGVAPGIVEGGGRASGYFTGATGTCILDEALGFGTSGHDTALVCDVGSNLVHRKQLTDQGLFWTACRIDAGTELLRSRDIWFRPVQLGDGPDGAVYVADMAREVIEHPQSLPPMIKRHLDLTSGRDLGRIWRLVPNELDLTSNRSLRGEDLRSLGLAHLFERLESNIPWQRMMASQLLIEGGASQPMRDELHLYLANTKSSAANSSTAKSSTGHILALHVAARLGLLTVEMLRGSLQSAEPRVVAESIQLAAEHDMLRELSNDLPGIAKSDLPRVQLALAMAAAQLEVEDRDKLLGRLLPRVSEPLVRAVVAVAAGDRAWQLIRDELAQQDEVFARGWFELLLPVWVQQVVHEKNAELAHWLESELQPANPLLPTWLDSLSGINNVQDALALWRGLGPDQWDRLQSWILDRQSQDNAKNDSIAWVMWLNESDQHRILEETLRPTVDEQRQAAIMQVVARLQSESLFSQVVIQLRQLTPRVQSHALRAIGSSKVGQQRLLAALEAGEIPVSLVAPDVRQLLVAGQERDMENRFQKVFAATTEERSVVVDRYRQSLAQAMEENPAQESGEAVFRRVCAQCHQLGAIGTQVGPPLRQLREKSEEQLLETILDPNREVDPRYMSYSIMLKDDRLLSGIIVEESAGQIKLQEAGGVLHSILRQDIDELKSSSLSLMPAGLESQVTPQQMRNLIQYLKAAD